MTTHVIGGGQAGACAATAMGRAAIVLTDPRSGRVTRALVKSKRRIPDALRPHVDDSLRMPA